MYNSEFDKRICGKCGIEGKCNDIVREFGGTTITYVRCDKCRPDSHSGEISAYPAAMGSCE